MLFCTFVRSIWLTLGRKVIVQVRHDGAGGIEETLHGYPASHCHTNYPQGTPSRRFTGKPVPNGSPGARGLDACQAPPCSFAMPSEREQGTANGGDRPSSARARCQTSSALALRFRTAAAPRTTSSRNPNGWPGAPITRLVGLACNQISQKAPTEAARNRWHGPARSYRRLVWAWRRNTLGSP